MTFLNSFSRLLIAIALSAVSYAAQGMGKGGGNVGDATITSISASRTIDDTYSLTLFFFRQNGVGTIVRSWRLNTTDTSDSTTVSSCDNTVTSRSIGMSMNVNLPAAGCDTAADG